MKLFGLDITRVDRFKKRAPAQAIKATPAYPSAMTSRLNEDFPILTLSADAATRGNLRELRARSQQLEREKGGIAERYFSCVEANVIGPDGIGLQLKVKNAAGEFDQAGSDKIEEAWEDFCTRGEFDITGEHSSQNFDRLSVRASARDGDAIQLIYRGAPTKSGIAFQLLDGQYLDDLFSVFNSATGTPEQNSRGAVAIAAGNQIRMGVEIDGFHRKVAYWILTRNPGDFFGMNFGYDGKRVRIPAFGTDPESMIHAIHVNRTKRPQETRSVPWITPAMDPINMLAGYEEAELIAARAQACKHVFYERQQFAPDGSPLDYGDKDPATGQLTETVEPGASTELPIGYHANAYNPTHPNQAFAEFTKDFRRKISAALNCSYNTLFTDLEGVNYSSIRAGLLDEREQWKMTQQWYIQGTKQLQFEAWLEMQLLSGALPGFAMRDFDRIRRATVWKPRRWSWVDPLKDIEAATASIEAKLTTRSRVIADQSNEDFEDTIDELAEERAYIKSKGLDPALAESPRLVNPAFTGNQPADATGDTSNQSSPTNNANDANNAENTDGKAAEEIPEPPHHSAHQNRDDGGRFTKGE